MSNYTQMWSDLGLDLKAHDAVLSNLGVAHQDISPTWEDSLNSMTVQAHA